MDTNRHKKALLDRESELEDQIARLRSEAANARVAEVEDPIDLVTSSEGQAAALEQTSRFADELEAVRAALQRIDSGDYGICLDCGEAIEEARLNAVAWTPYCLKDQEKHDRQRAAAASAGDIS